MTDSNPALRVLFLASAKSYRMAPFLAAAERLGVEAVQGLDVPPPLVAKARAESPNVLPLDYRDVDKSTTLIRRFAETTPVTAIVGLDDSGAVMAALASAALRLPHNSPDATHASRNKHLMRRLFARGHVPSPGFRLWHFDDDPVIAAEATRYPCVLKPTALSGSQGVMRAVDPGEFAMAWDRLRPILAQERCDEILVEDYIAGVEVALEGLLDDGRLHVLALFDKPDPLDGPFFEETLYVSPSRLPGSTQQAIAGATLAAAAALGLRTGPIHAELRVNEQGPWVVEVAARSIGGLCSQTLRFGDDVSLEELILRQALGLPIDTLELQAYARGVMMIPIPAAGVLTGVNGLEEAAAMPLIEDIEITAPLQYPVTPLPEGNSYLGFIFAHGKTPEAVEAALRAAHARLVFVITPELELTPRLRK